MNEGKWKEWFWRWGPAVVMMALIFLASSTPSRDIPTFGHADWLVKKGGHFLGYALLAYTYVLGFGGNRPRSFMLAFLLLVIYAASDEVHQLFTPGRHSSPIDVGIDSLGGVLSLAIQAGWWQLQRKSHPQIE